MSQNEFLSEKIKNLDADYQMLISSGNYEPSCDKCLISEGSVFSKNKLAPPYIITSWIIASAKSLTITRNSISKTKL